MKLKLFTDNWYEIIKYLYVDEFVKICIACKMFRLLQNDICWEILYNRDFHDHDIIIYTLYAPNTYYGIYKLLVSYLRLCKILTDDFRICGELYNPNEDEEEDELVSEYFHETLIKYNQKSKKKIKLRDSCDIFNNYIIEYQNDEDININFRCIEEEIDRWAAKMLNKNIISEKECLYLLSINDMKRLDITKTPVLQKLNKLRKSKYRNKYKFIISYLTNNKKLIDGIWKVKSSKTDNAYEYTDINEIEIKDDRIIIFLSSGHEL